jgi:hypothetical protein
MRDAHAGDDGVSRVGFLRKAFGNRSADLVGGRLARRVNDRRSGDA